MSRILGKLLCALSMALLLVVGGFVPARAATVFWINNGSGTSWSSGSNWNTGTAPGVSDIALFDQTSYTVQPNSGTAAVSGVQIGDGTTAAGALTLGGSLLTTGSNGITMYANAGAATFNVPLAFSSSQTFTNNSASVLTISNSINNGSYLLTVAGSGTTYFTGPRFSGSGGLTKTGSGLLQISGSNNSTQSPTVTINGGTLQLANGNNDLPVGTTLSLANSAGATWDLNSQNQQVQYLSGGGTAGGTITLGSGTLTITGGNTTSETFAGVISGAGAVVKSSGNSMLFSGSNSTYSGGTTLGGNGTVTFSASSILSGNNLVSGPFGTGPITFTGGGSFGPSMTTPISLYNPLVFSNGAAGITLGSVGNNKLILAGSVTLSAGTNNVSVYYNSSGSLTGAVSGAGGLNLTGGGGPLVLSGSNTYSGGTILSGGNANLQFTGASVLSGSNIVSGPVGTGPITFTGAGSFSPNNTTPLTVYNPLVFSNGTAGVNLASVSSSNLTLAGSTTVSAGTNSISTAYNSSALLTGSMSGPGGLKLNGGNCTITGFNSYLGGTTIAGGGVKVSTDSVLSGGALVSGPLGTGPITFAGGGSLSPTDTSMRTINNPLVFSDGTSGILLSGYGLGNLTLTGSAIVSAGTNSVSSYNYVSLTGPMSGPGGLNLTQGYFTLSGTNSFSGGVNAAGAQGLQLAQASQGSVGNIISGPLGTGTFVINSNSTVLSSDTGTSGQVRQIFNPVIINSNFEFGTYQDGSKIKLSGPITLNVTPTIAVRGGGNGSTISQGSDEIAGNVGGANGITVTYGEAPLILSGSNTYAGPTTLSPGILEAGSTTGFSPSSTVVETTSNAYLRLNGFSNTIASLSGAIGAAGTVDNNSTIPATITLGGDNTSTTFAGQIDNCPYGATATAALSLAKVGSGAFTYIGGNGSNPYSGTTQASGGTLAFDYSQYAVNSNTVLSNQFGTGASPLVSAGGVFQLKGRASGTAASLGSATWSGTSSSTVSVTSTGGLVPGEVVTSAGFQSGTYVVAVTSPTTFTLSKSTTTNSTSAGVTVSAATFTCSQTFSGLTLNPGSSVIDANNSSTQTTVDLRGSAGTSGINRVTGALVDFTASNGGFGSTAVIKTHQADDATGILGGWATVLGGSGYAANNGSDVVVPYAGYQNFNTQGSAINGTATTNIQISAVTTGGSDTLAASTVNVDTIFQNATGPTIIALASGTLRLGPSGGILLSPTAGGLTVGANPGDGTLTAGKSDLSQGGELILNNNSTSPLLINASITDNAPGAAVAVTKAGAGSLVLAGSNTLSGGLYINGGTVQLASSGALNATGANNVTFGSGVNTGATLELNGNSVTISGLASDPLSTSAVIESGSTTGSTDVLTVNSNATNLFSGVLQNGPSGTLGLVKSGSGSLALNGQNTYSGSTTVNAGAVAINGTLSNSPVTVGSGAVLSGTGSIGNPSLNNAVTVNNGGWITPGVAGVGTLSIATSGSVALGSGGTASMAVAVGAASAGLLNISGNLSSASQVTVYPSLSSGDTPATTATIAQWTSGTGPSSGWTLNFSRASSGVVLWLGGSDNNWSTAANWNLNALTAGNLVYTSTSVQVTGLATAPSTPLVTNSVVIAPAGNAAVTSPTSATTVAALSVGAQTGVNTAQLTLGGPLTVSGTAAVNAPGTLDLGGNTLTSAQLNVAGILQGTGGLIAGPTVVQAGGTMIATASNFGASPLTFNGGTLQFGQNTPADVSIGRTFAISSSGMTINTNNYSGTLAGSLGGNGGLTVQGSGLAILSGSNTYTGGTTISAGTLQLGDGSINNGYVQGNIANQSMLVFANPAGQTYGGVVSGNGSLIQAGPGTLALIGSNTFSGGTTISAGTLQIGTGGSTGSVSAVGGITDNSALVFNLANGYTYGGVISGSGNLTQGGSGTLALAGSNTYSGATIVTSGTLQMGNASALGNSGSLTVNSAALDLHGYSPTVGALTGNSGAVITTFNGNNSFTLTTNTATNSTFAGTFQSNGGTMSLVKTGSGTLTLTGTSNYTGTTSVNAGTLEFTTIGSAAGGASTALGNPSGTNSVINLGSGTTLRFTGDHATTTRVINLTGNAAIDASGPNQSDVFKLAGNGNSVTYSSGSGANLTLQGSSTQGGEVGTPLNLGTGSLTKAGSGTWTLDTANSYSGGTYLNAGTLFLANGASGSALGSGNVTINGGTLTTGGGNVSISGSVQSGTGPYVIAPGPAPTQFGDLTVGGLATASNLTTLNFDLGSPLSGTSYSGDLITISNSSASALAISPSTSIALSSLPGAAGAQYRLLQDSNSGGAGRRREQLPPACVLFERREVHVGRHQRPRLSRPGRDRGGQQLGPWCFHDRRQLGPGDDRIRAQPDGYRGPGGRQQQHRIQPHGVRFGHVFQFDQQRPGRDQWQQQRQFPGERG